MKRLARLLVFLWLGISVFAVEGVLEVRKSMIDEDGKEYLEVTDSVYPGDILEYSYVITNDDDEIIMGLEPIIPVPKSTVVMPETIEPKNFMVSVDGNTYIDYPVLDMEGKEVPNSAYKKIKWMLGGMNPHDQVIAKMRVKVDSE